MNCLSYINEMNECVPRDARQRAMEGSACATSSILWPPPHRIMLLFTMHAAASLYIYRKRSPIRVRDARVTYDLGLGREARRSRSFLLEMGWNVFMSVARFGRVRVCSLHLYGRAAWILEVCTHMAAAPLSVLTSPATPVRLKPPSTNARRGEAFPAVLSDGRQGEERSRADPGGPIKDSNQIPLKIDRSLISRAVKQSRRDSFDSIATERARLGRWADLRSSHSSSWEAWGSMHDSGGNPILVLS